VGKSIYLLGWTGVFKLRENTKAPEGRFCVFVLSYFRTFFYYFKTSIPLADLPSILLDQVDQLQVLVLASLIPQTLFQLESVVQE